MGEDVELCLEVQVDPASKRILSNPEKCRSALLDVTVVKPKEVEAFGTHRTNTLRADEVRKLITSMEKQRRKKQKVLDQLKDDDTIIQIRKHDIPSSPHKSKNKFTRRKSPIDDIERKDFIGITESVEPLFCEIRRSLKNVETRITNMQDINFVISQTTVDQSASEEYIYSKKRDPSCHHYRKHSVYRVETTPRELKSMLCCKNRQRDGKLEGRCMCENCGIVGLLQECQKGPIMTDSPVSSHHKSMFKKETRFNIPSPEDFKNKLYECSHINHLNNRIQILEERLSAQEERLVPKDYFKKIITKVVTNLSPKIFKSKSDTSVHSCEKPKKKTDKATVSHVGHCRSTETFCYNCTTHHGTRGKSDKSTTTEDEILFGGFIWKWGEEILKPGIDLKNKILALLNEVLSKLSLNDKEVKDDSKQETDSEIFKRFMKQINQKVFTTHQMESKAKDFENNNNKEKVHTFDSVHAKVLSHFSKKQTEQHNHQTHHHRHQHERETDDGKESVKFNKSVNISYVNPKLSLWRTETTEACKGENAKVDEKSNVLGKREFIKIISKAKQHQKDVLWTNIWNQAKANGQSKEDTITIKIPCHESGDGNNNKETNAGGRGGQKMYETEITIGEVEVILKGAGAAGGSCL